ncbi:MAG: hypothetical protein K9N06_00080 [Candidatus Cloacimonetes bacterium]|nr:hypothetical protein [Candidatus Cloacimonadota bacterium]
MTEIFYKILLIGLILLVTSGLYAAEESVSVSALRDSSLADSLAATSLQLDSLFYAAESGDYWAKEQIISLYGTASIDYHSSSLTADTITVKIQENQAFTFGKSMLKDRDMLALGNEISYDLKTRWGMIINGATKFEQGYYYGDEIRKIDDEIYDIDAGLFTTCDAQHPHFYIKTNRMRLYKDDKVVGRPVIFYVNHLPVFAFPYGVFPVKKGRQPGLLVPYPGYNSHDGKYLRDIAFYYPYQDYADIILGGDLYEKTGWEAHLSMNYIKRYELNGNLLFRLRHERFSLISSTYEWYLRQIHHQNIGLNSTLDANITYISSQRIMEGEEDANDRLAEDVKSTITYKTMVLGSTLNLTGKLEADLLDTSEVRRDSSSTIVDTLTYKKKTITLPSVSWSRSPRPLYEYFVGEDSDIDEDAWYAKISGSYNFRGIYISVLKDSTADFADWFWKEKEDSLGVINEHEAAMKHSTTFRYSNKYRGWLSYSQSASYNLAWFDEDNLEQKSQWGRDWNLDTSLNFNLYGIRNFKRGYIKGLRHIMTPKVSYRYSPDFSENENLDSIGGISVSSGDRQQKISFSLSNIWQLKLRKTEAREEKNINDFFKINSAISYDLENKNTGYNEGKGFSSLSHAIYLNPNSLKLGIVDFSVSPKGSITQDVYDWEFKGTKLNRWDWGVSNWDCSLTTKLSIGGNADYVEYFPLEDNPFTSNKFLVSDSLSLEEENELTTLEEIEELEREQKNWSFNITHSYRLTQSTYESHDYTSNLKASLTAQLTRNWNFSYSNYYDLNENKMVSQNFTLLRELHCWRLEFRYTRQENYWNYSLKLFNIKLPDSLKFKTSDSG